MQKDKHAENASYSMGWLIVSLNATLGLPVVTEQLNSRLILCNYNIELAGFVFALSRTSA